MKEKILVSACLLGHACRYDGASKPHAGVMALADTYTLIPVCPEMQGGLLCPRPPSEIQGDRVCNVKGDDVTAEYRRGADEVVKIALRERPVFAILKSRSPACGHGQVYDGTFTGTLTSGDGITAAALLDIGVKVYTEEEINTLI